MPIALTTEQRAALRRGEIGIRALIDFYLDSGRYSFWDGDFPWNFEGTQYQPASEFGEISAISTGADLGAEGMEFRMNGTRLRELGGDAVGDPAALFGTLDRENYQLRRVEIRFAFFDAETGLLLFVIKRFAGFIDTVKQVEEIGDDGRAAIWLIASLESIARRYQVRGARTRSHDDQQDIHPGDTFFKFTPSAVAQAGTLYWGRASPNEIRAGVTGSGGRVRVPVRLV